MKTLLIILWLGTNASAHRLDEYLQATTISLEEDSVQAQIRLTPGIAVLPVVIAAIDSNDDGVISPLEQRAYSERVLRDLSLAIDGDHMKLRIVSAKFPTTDAMKEGLGEIQIDFAAYVPRDKPGRKLVLENHHLREISAYLVNCLVPRHPDIRVVAQKRNYEQSLYELEYVQTAAPSDGYWWLGLVAMLLLARMAVLLRRRVEPRHGACLARDAQ